MYGAVGGAHFAQHGARALHDIRNAEAVADFDQFAARDDHFVAGGQFVQRQINGGGVVVHRDAGRAEQPLEERAGVDVALAAPSRGEVVFEIGVAGVDGWRRLAARGPDWYAAPRRWR